MEPVWQRIVCLLASGLFAGLFAWALRGLRQKREAERRTRQAIEAEAAWLDRQKEWLLEKEQLQGRLDALAREATDREQSQAQQTVALQAQLQSRSAAISSFQDEREGLRQQLEARDAELARALSQSREHEARLREARAEAITLRERLGEIEARDPSGPELEQRARAQQTAIKDRDATIAKLQRQVSDLAGQLATLGEKESWQQAALTGKEAEIQEKEGEIRRLRAQLDELVARPAQPRFPLDEQDDLQLIRGIGPVLAKMLRDQGVTTFRQVAQWTEQDIDRVDEKLGKFRGRIRRDNWIESAREQHQKKYGTPP